MLTATLDRIIDRHNDAITWYQNAADDAGDRVPVSLQSRRSELSQHSAGLARAISRCRKNDLSCSKLSTRCGLFGLTGVCSGVIMAFTYFSHSDSTAMNIMTAASTIVMAVCLAISGYTGVMWVVSYMNRNKELKECESHLEHMLGVIEELGLNPAGSDEAEAVYSAPRWESFASPSVENRVEHLTDSEADVTDAPSDEPTLTPTKGLFAPVNRPQDQGTHIRHEGVQPVKRVNDNDADEVTFTPVTLSENSVEDLDITDDSIPTVFEVDDDNSSVNKAASSDDTIAEVEEEIPDEDYENIMSSVFPEPVSNVDQSPVNKQADEHTLFPQKRQEEEAPVTAHEQTTKPQAAFKSVDEIPTRAQWQARR